MPTVINQAGVSVDSLQAKILILENTIKEANIKTSFYSDQLAFQLFVFSAILAVLGFISWRSFIKPPLDKLKNLEEERIPKLIKAVTDEKNQQIDSLKKEYDNLKSLVYKSYLTQLRTNVVSSESMGFPEAAVNLLVQYLALNFKFQKENINKDRFRQDLNYAYELLTTKPINFVTLRDIESELEDFLSFIIKNGDHEISILALRVLDKIKEYCKINKDN